MNRSLSIRFLLLCVCISISSLSFAHNVHRAYKVCVDSVPVYKYKIPFSSFRKDEFLKKNDTILIIEDGNVELPEHRRYRFKLVNGNTVGFVEYESLMDLYRKDSVNNKLRRWYKVATENLYVYVNDKKGRQKRIGTLHKGDTIASAITNQPVPFGRRFVDYKKTPNAYVYTHNFHSLEDPFHVQRLVPVVVTRSERVKGDKGFITLSRGDTVLTKMSSLTSRSVLEFSYDVYNYKGTRLGTIHRSHIRIPEFPSKTYKICMFLLTCFIWFVLVAIAFAATDFSWVTMVAAFSVPTIGLLFYRYEMFWFIDGTELTFGWRILGLIFGVTVFFIFSSLVMACLKSLLIWEGFFSLILKLLLSAWGIWILAYTFITAFNISPIWTFFMVVGAVGSPAAPPIRGSIRLGNGEIVEGEFDQHGNFHGFNNKSYRKNTDGTLTEI